MSRLGGYEGTGLDKGSLDREHRLLALLDEASEISSKPSTEEELGHQIKTAITSFGKWLDLDGLLEQMLPNNPLRANIEKDHIDVVEGRRLLEFFRDKIKEKHSDMGIRFFRKTWLMFPNFQRLRNFVEKDGWKLFE